jgi:hypothetical protein
MKRTDTIRVAVVNHSTAISDENAAQGVAAMQKQISEDFGPVWNIQAVLQFAGKERLRDSLPDHWGLILVDDAAQSEQLGYHDLTSSGLPLATILVSSIPAGQDWTHSASHELMEMLADPGINLAIYSRPDDVLHRIYAHEICDPCAAYEDGYAVAGRQLSDFVFPGWFHEPAGGQRRRDAGERYDERGLIKTPLELRPGGYIGLLDPGTFAWSLLRSGSDTPGAIPDGSRMQLRATTRSNWQLSDMDWIP